MVDFSLPVEQAPRSGLGDKAEPPPFLKGHKDRSVLVTRTSDNPGDVAAARASDYLKMPK